MMSVTQVRLPNALIEEVEQLVKKGHYANKSDVIRDAVRKFILEKQVSSIPGDDSLKDAKSRKDLSGEEFDIKKIHYLG
jgi:Arc/MetJ-type ribon-helix-helix transcriptional regulator